MHRQLDEMSQGVATEDRADCYRGLRMSAEGFLALGETRERYELLDGVVCMSPSPNFRHQQILVDIGAQVATYLQTNAIGSVAAEVDVRFRNDLVYCPDLIYLRAEKAARCGSGAVTEVPDLLVEIVSPDSRSYDTKTKRGDYESAGVGEYWVIDPQRESFLFLVLHDGKFREASSSGDRYDSTVLPGMSLDLARVRACFPSSR